MWKSRNSLLGIVILLLFFSMAAFAAQPINKSIDLRFAREFESDVQKQSTSNEGLEVKVKKNGYSCYTIYNLPKDSRYLSNCEIEVEVTRVKGAMVGVGFGPRDAKVLFTVGKNGDVSLCYCDKKHYYRAWNSRIKPVSFPARIKVIYSTTDNNFSAYVNDQEICALCFKDLPNVPNLSSLKRVMVVTQAPRRKKNVNALYRSMNYKVY